MREILCVATERSLKCHDFLSGSELSRVDEVLTTCENGLFTLGGRGHLRGNVLGCIDPRKPLLRLYRLEKFKAAIRRLPLPEMGTCADSSSDGILLAVGTASGNLHIWDLTSGRFLRSMNVFPERINQVSFVDQLLVVSRGHTVNIYTISDVICPQDGSYGTQPLPFTTFDAHKKEIRMADFSLDSSCCDGLAVSLDQSGILFVWRLRTGEILAVIDLDCPQTAVVLDKALGGSRCFIALQRGEATTMILEVNLVRTIQHFHAERAPLFPESPAAEGMIRTIAVLDSEGRGSPSSGRGEGLHNQGPFLLRLNVQDSHLVVLLRDGLRVLDLESGQVRVKMTSNPLDPITGILIYVEYPTVKDLALKVHPLRSVVSHRVISADLSDKIEHRLVDNNAENLSNFSFGLAQCDLWWVHQRVADVRNEENLWCLITMLWNEFLQHQKEESVIQADSRRLEHLRAKIMTSADLLDSLIRRKHDTTSTTPSEDPWPMEVSGRAETKNLLHCASAVSIGGLSDESVLRPTTAVIALLDKQPSSYSRPPMNWIFSDVMNCNVQLKE